MSSQMTNVLSWSDDFDRRDTSEESQAELFLRNGELNQLAKQVSERSAEVGSNVFTLMSGKSSSQLQSITPSTTATPAILLAEWSGCVVEIDKSGHFFRASLKGIAGEQVKGEEEEALIPISDVSAADMQLLRAGNFFRLCVMHEKQRNGQTRRFTQIIFRRLPAYHRSDIEDAESWADEIARALRVE